MPTTLIIAAKSGQLGNRLFTASYYMAFAKAYGYRFLNPSFDEYAPYFEGTCNNPLSAFPKSLPLPAPAWLHHSLYNFNRQRCKSNRFNVINIERSKPFSLGDQAFQRQIKPNALNFIQGWLFREGWFLDDRELLSRHAISIKTYFTPIRYHQNRVSQRMKTLRKDNEIVIGVHVRQGDYQSFKSGRYFYEFSQYVELIKGLRQQFGDRKIAFLICSNVNQDLSGLSDINSVYSGTGNLIEDMYLLAECDYLIGPPSSYSMWASFYGNVPLYMLRDDTTVPQLNDFVSFYDWAGRFNAHEDWSQSTWDWFSKQELSLMN